MIAAHSDLVSATAAGSGEDVPLRSFFADCRWQV